MCNSFYINTRKNHSIWQIFSHYAINLSKFLPLAFILAWPQQALAWNNTGHMLVAQIAYEQMTPTARRRANGLIHVLDAHYRPTDFVHAASWPDELKYHDIHTFDHWHYIDKGFSHDGSKFQVAEKQNIVWAIHKSLKGLRSRASNTFEKALMLRFLIHFVGDIHQPLHCASLHTKKHPDGDKGGTLYMITVDRATSLHRYWDSALGEYQNKRNKPQTLKRFAQDLIKK